MKNWAISIGISGMFIGLSIGVIIGNENLLNYLLFGALVLLPFSLLVIVVAVVMNYQAEQGDKESIDVAKRILNMYNKTRANIGSFAMLFAMGTTLYFGWIGTAVLLAISQIICIPFMSLIKQAAACEPSFGDETSEAIKNSLRKEE